MEKEKNTENNWVICPKCQGRSKKRYRLNKKTLQKHQLALDEFEKSKEKENPPELPKGQPYACSHCSGSGILSCDNSPNVDTKNSPNIAIIGGGIGGVALAVACLHRGIPFTLYERDINFNSRSQGYGLTLQQASRSVAGLGVLSLKDGVVSTRHVVHNTTGEIIGEWGMRKWMQPQAAVANKRTNIHIARQSLRLALLEQLHGHDVVKWQHQLIDFNTSESNDISLNFSVEGKTKKVKADLIVGADGIRSTVRNILLGSNDTPLQYLGCIVILGICPLTSLEKINSPLLDGATVFQTVNGYERIYMMPFDSENVMWQLSFPMPEEDAKELSKKGAEALKEESITRTQWHTPVPEIVKATKATQISGYPVYDRALLTPEALRKNNKVTLIGDAAHPMSPFKGQGANQALLDALSLAREISTKCKPSTPWSDTQTRIKILTAFETEMLTRTASKVKDSATAVKMLHSEAVLLKSNEPRGREPHNK